MRQKPRARRKTHALEPAVEHPDNAERRDGRAQAEKQIHQRGSRQAQHHERARVAAVSQKSIGELGDAIEDPVEG